MAEQAGKTGAKITVTRDGPYIVSGGVPLVRKAAVVTDQGEPVTWKKTADLPSEQEYALCRCGHSHEKPFCDGTHCEIEFDGDETADPRPMVERQVTLPGGRALVVRRDYSLCCEAGFCANRFTSVEKLLPAAEDPGVLLQIIAMIERCPSGSYTYAFSEQAAEMEPDLPQQVAVTTEMTSDGPIMGPLWVTGWVPLERADHQPIESRNRVTLCRCGLSKNKPLCDGAHRRENVKED